MKNDSYSTLIGRAGIVHAKGHDYAMEVNHGRPKGGLLGVGRVHFDLVIATEYVYEGEHQMTSSGVD